MIGFSALIIIFYKYIYLFLFFTFSRFTYSDVEAGHDDHRGFQNSVPALNENKVMNFNNDNLKCYDLMRHNFFFFFFTENYIFQV